MGLAQLNLERFAAAADTFEVATRLNPDDEAPFAALAATYALQGLTEKAKSAVARCNALRVRRGGAPITIATMRFAIGSGCGCNGVLDRVDLNRLQHGLRLAGVPASLSEGEFAEQNKLNGAEIRSLVVGHRLHGRSLSTGEQHAAAVTADGVAEISGDWVSGGPLTGGSVHLEDDELCYKFDVVRYCGTVLRNPGGTRVMENEFIWQTGSPFTFSQVD